MAEYNYYMTRQKLSKTWVSNIQAKGANLSDKEKRLLPNINYNGVSRDNCKLIWEFLDNGTYQTLSEVYQKEFHDLVDVCVRKEWQEDFYYALDEMNCYQMTFGSYRRSLRSKSYIPFAEDGIHLLWAYARLDFYNADLADILTGNVNPEIYDHVWSDEYFHYAGILAAQIDHDNGQAIRAVKDILFGENNTMMMRRELILSIVMSKVRNYMKTLASSCLPQSCRKEQGRWFVKRWMPDVRKHFFLYFPSSKKTTSSATLPLSVLSVHGLEFLMNIIWSASPKNCFA